MENITAFFTTYSEELPRLIITKGVFILAIVIGIVIINRILSYSISRAVRRFIKQDTTGGIQAEEKREDTLISVFSKTSRVLVWVLGGLIILSELGVNIAPLLAAAGVAGIAFGFGGQYLIRDIITGLFIIFENQYRVGDVVALGGVSGVVESINLRLTVLRDLDGNVHHIPNGEVSIASNMTKGYSRIHVDIGVGYGSDIEKVTKTVNQVGSAMATDPEWKGKIIKAPAFLRVNEFADSAVIVKILGETEPGEQWAVAGEFRKRLKYAFDQAGIEIPFPQRVVHTAN